MKEESQRNCQKINELHEKQFSLFFALPIYLTMFGKHEPYGVIYALLKPFLTFPPLFPNPNSFFQFAVLISQFPGLTETLRLRLLAPISQFIEHSS